MSRVALVTGAGSGIAAEVARGLAKAGHRLILVDADAHALAAVAAELGEAALADRPWVLDARDARAVAEAFAALADRPDILVNGVGGDARRIGVEDLDEDAFLESYRHNLLTSFSFIRHSVPAMKARGWGRIVNLASIAGRTYSVFSNAGYVAAKAAVIGLTKQCAFELAPHGITVNAVAHGPIGTERIDRAWAEKTPEQRAAILERIPAGRMGTVAEAAAAVLPFCAQYAGFTTGAVLDVNGGLHI
ncbi:MAG TPA: SDR family oxidoreductase [Actinocrinis sp.]|nr:SDR family oxidoreductase [Actinocrinis sp.]